MKKTFLFAAFAALITFASCQKEVVSVQNQGEDLVFTAIIADQDTKTSVDASAGKVTWADGDRITVRDIILNTSAEYEVSAINEGCATFTKVDGQPTLGSGPYVAFCGTVPATSQTYSATASALPMMATSETNSLVFTVTCGLIELSLTAVDSVTSIAVTGTPLGESETTYTLTCPEAVDISSGAKFYIALPAGSYTSFLINGQNGAQCKKEGPGVTISANHITPVSFKTLRFAVQLWADGPYWATTNIGATSETDYGQYFAWGYPEGQTPNGTRFSGTPFSACPWINISTLDAAHDMATANWGADWCLPTEAQLKTLINTDNSGKCSVTFVKDGTYGIRITGTETGYTSNSIFLPAAGEGAGDGLTLQFAGEEGFYWANAQSRDGLAYAMHFYFGGTYYSWKTSKFVTSDTKDYGYSVRPVRSGQLEPYRSGSTDGWLND